MNLGPRSAMLSPFKSTPGVVLMRYLLLVLALALSLCCLAGCDDDNPIPYHGDAASTMVVGGSA